VGLDTGSKANPVLLANEENMIKKRNSLALRIAIPFTLLLLLTMGGLGIYLYTYIQESYLNILEQNLLAETRLIADRLAVLEQEQPGENAAIAERVNQYAKSLNVRVTVIDPQGVVIAETQTIASEMENHLNRPEIQSALKNQVTTEIRFSKTLQTEMLYAAAPMKINNETVGVVRLAVSLNNIQRRESTILQTVLIATTIAALLTILLAVLVSIYTIYPLKQLTDTAQRVANGDLAQITTTFRRDEIGQLQQAVKNMAFQLKEQIDELSTERTKLEIILANMTDGIIIVDQSGTVQLINPAALRLFHMQDEDALQKTLIEVVRHHQLVELWRQCLISGAQETTTLETSPDRLFLQGIATPLHESLPGMTLMVFQDLTRVRKLETVRRDFVSNVSHELRTPLASLKALTETLQEGALEDPPAARRFLQRMETEIDNLTQMVHELLELSRIESNKVPLRRVSTSPCELATPAVERMQLQAERAGLSLRMECTDDLPMVKADPERMEQVLVNLIHNAIKFTPPGGHIIVSAFVDLTNVVFFVKDTGVGIPPEAINRIFERFFKTDRSRSGRGTGLGLSISRHLIEAHGGRIWAESLVNQGSTFFFTLPIVQTTSTFIKQPGYSDNKTRQNVPVVYFHGLGCYCAFTKALTIINSPSL
jgi:two-component system, OmpR family, phosphate regulon sensor histidine kinase PhoR